MKIVSKQVYINRAIVNVKTFCAQYLHAIACFVAHLQCNLKKKIHLYKISISNFEIAKLWDQKFWCNDYQLLCVI